MVDFLLYSALILILLSLLGSWIFFMMGFGRMKKTWLLRSRDLKGVDFSPFKTDQAWFFDQKPQDLWIQSKDHLKLHAYYLPSIKPPSVLVILHHGYATSAKMMASYAKFYRAHYDAAILAIDMRAHGQSEGKFLGFGWLEKDDTRLWIDQMNALLDQPLPIILHGISMGASTILNLAGNDCPAQVKAVIADSGFSDLNRQFKRQFKEIFNLPAFPLIPLGSLWCRIILGFSFKTASPINTASQITVPTLIIHGLKDMFVPHPMSDDLYAALTCPKQLVHYPNAPHALTYPLNQDDYENQVLTFLGKALP